MFDGGGIMANDGAIVFDSDGIIVGGGTGGLAHNGMYPYSFQYQPTGCCRAYPCPWNMMGRLL